MFSQITRRNLMLKTIQGGSALSLGSFLGLPLAQGKEKAKEPHFFLTIYVQGGMDGTYLFDARPLSMTASGKIQNYLNTDPQVWTGVNGQSCLTSKLVEPLHTFKDRLTVINGVLMAATFDGHDQNLNYLFTGNPFGGESFVPHLNHGDPMPLDYIQAGFFFGLQISNSGAGVPLSIDSARSLKQKLTSGTISSESTMMRHIKSRIADAAKGKGSFARGSAEMEKKWAQLFQVADSFQGMNLAESAAAEAEEVQFTRLAMAAFERRVTPSALISTTFEQFDTHDATSAKKQPEIFTKLVGKLAAIFALLRDTPFDQATGKSFLDVTTVMVVSEFGRTMRQPGSAIDNTGTDHNPLTNSVILLGKGIRGGMVVGASDLTTSEEELTGAHKSLDREGIKIMGRPFDFAALSPRADRPDVFNSSDYLSFASIANSFYELFGVDKNKHWAVERLGPTAPLLRGVIG